MKEVYSKRRFLTFNRIRYLPTDRKKTIFMQLSNINFIFSNSFFFAFLLKFGKTKQIVVTFVATTLKALLSVAKANGRLSGRKLYAGNIDYPFLDIFAHISPINIQKGAQPKPRTRKSTSPYCCETNL